MLIQDKQMITNEQHFPQLVLLFLSVFRAILLLNYFQKIK